MENDTKTSKEDLRVKIGRAISAKCLGRATKLIEEAIANELLAFEGAASIECRTHTDKKDIFIFEGQGNYLITFNSSEIEDTKASVIEYPDDWYSIIMTARERASEVVEDLRDETSVISPYMELYLHRGETTNEVLLFAIVGKNLNKAQVILLRGLTHDKKSLVPTEFLEREN